MKLYYHKTSGGAEYYCTKPISEDSEEGDLHYAVMRTDCNELELFMANLADEHIRVVIER